MVDNSVEISLITVSYNSAEVLKACWRNFKQGTVEWVVVDNNSSDDSVVVARSLGAIVIPLEQNLGFSAANNIGAEAARGSVLIFCNPDIVATNDGAVALAARARSLGAIVAPQLLNRDGSPQENGRGAPYPVRKLRHMFGKTQDHRYLRFAAEGQVRRVVWVMGAAVAITRDAFTAIGGWNSNYFIYYEDSEICLRAADNEVPTYVDGDVRWLHGWGRETARGFSIRAWKFEVLSGVRFYASHLYCVMPIGRRGRALRAIDRMAGQ